MSDDTKYFLAVALPVFLLLGLGMWLGESSRPGNQYPAAVLLWGELGPRAYHGLDKD